MIKINLSPIEELENKLWYLPDLLVFLSISAAGYFGVQFYFQQVQEKINQINFEREDFEKSYRRLKPDLDKFTRLNQEDEQLQKKLNSLKQITVSKTERYKPVILLEHIQNLKPEGIWLNHYEDSSSSGVIRISGKTFDNLLVAGFMSALVATKLQEVDPSDIRTQVYFSKVHLEKVAYSGASAPDANDANRDRTNQAFNATQDQDLRKSSSKSGSDSSSLFPELSHFPSFEMNIRYAERSRLRTSSQTNEKT